jgi:hypothetical protein
MKEKGLQEQVANSTDDEIALYLSLARRAVEFLADEAGRRGMTDVQVAAKTHSTVAKNDDALEEFIGRLKAAGGQ